MTNEQFSTLIQIVVVVLAVFQGLGIYIVQEILKNKIGFEFKKREQAAMIANLFSEWISFPENNKVLNKLTWEANLWLPDNTAKEVNKRLANAPDAKDIREIIVDVKKEIHGKRSTLVPSEIVYFQKK